MASLGDEEGAENTGENCKLIQKIDIPNSRYPLCIVWTSLPIVSWLAPFFGHVGICREDGVILDFSGSYLVNTDNFAFGAPSRFVQLDMRECCFPPHLSGHTCSSGFEHSMLGTSLSWDDGLHTSVRSYGHRSHNLFTCNSHSFVANFLNRVAYQGSIKWNIISVVMLVVMKGQWVSKWAVFRSLAPFIVVLSLGLLMVGLPFFAGWAVFEFLLIAWFIIGTYIKRGLIEC